MKYPADLLLVDNSSSLAYVEKVKEYCKKIGITNYKITHFDINQLQIKGEKIGRSREMIRQEVLKNGYDAWFSWESDQIIPPNALGKLVTLMHEGDFNMVIHNSWSKEHPGQPTFFLSIALVGKDPLQKYSFLIDNYADDPDMNVTWYRAEEWFKKQIRRDGGNYIEVSGVIRPVQHL